MRRLAFLAIVLAALAMALQGAFEQRQHALRDATPMPQAVASKRMLVVARNNRFAPSAIRVGRADTIHFMIKNLDPADHEYVLIPAVAPPC